MAGWEGRNEFGWINEFKVKRMSKSQSDIVIRKGPSNLSQRKKVCLNILKENHKLVKRLQKVK